MAEDMKAFTTNADLPEPKIKKNKKTGKDEFVGYAEARYFMRMTAEAYELIKVHRKRTGILRRHCFTMKRRNKAHMAQFKKFKEAGIPVIS